MAIALEQQSPAVAVAAAVEKVPAWKWGVVWLMFLATLINYLDRQTLSNTSSFIIKEFHLSNEDFGWIDSYFGVAFATIQFPAGYLADRFNLRWLYAAALLVWSVAGFATGMAHTIMMVAACRMVLAVGESFNWPCAVAVVRRLLPRESQSVANGVFHAGASIGAALTPILVVMVVGKNGEHWRWLFEIVGAFGLIWAVLWFWVIRGKRAEVITPRDTKPAQFSHVVMSVLVGLTPAIAFVVLQMVWRRVESGSTAAVLIFVVLLEIAGVLGLLAYDMLWRPRVAREEKSFVHVMSLPQFWITVAIGIAVNVAWHFYRLWLPRYFELDLHCAPGDTRFVITNTGFYLFADVGCMTAGYMMRELARRGRSIERARKIVCLCASLLCLLSAPAVLVHNAWISVPLLFLVAAGTMGNFTIFFTLSQEISPHHTALCLGVIGGACWYILAGFQPLVGWVVDKIGTFVPIIIAIGFVPLIGALIGMLWPEPKPQQGIMPGAALEPAQ